MKRTLYVLAAACWLSLIMVTCAVAQESLADVARQQRSAKRPSSAKVYTNDDFAPVHDSGKPEAAASDKAGAKGDEGKADEKDKSKLAAEFKAKADELKKNISLLQREMDVAQRDYKLKVAVYYADAGNNLRDPKKWAEEDRKQRAELDAKQKQLDDTKQKLTDLQEQARKAGVRID